MKGRKWLVCLLALALMTALPLTALADVQEKSWDVNGDRIYNIVVSNGGYITVVVDGTDDIEFDGALVRAADWIEESMRGAWTITQIDGDLMDVTLTPDENFPSTSLYLKNPEADKTGIFDVCYVSDSLKNPLHKLVSVTTVSDKGAYVDNIAYKKTEHTVKTGERYVIDAPVLLPEDAELIQGIGWAYSDESLYPLYDKGCAYVDFDFTDGSFAVMIGEAGTYTVKVQAALTANLVKDVTHTFTVTGAPTNRELPEFELYAELPDTTRVYEEERPDHWLTSFDLIDGGGYEDDEFEWSVEQTKGEKVETRIETGGGFHGDLFVDGPFPVGDYAFTVTLKDVTRDISDSEGITVRVENNEQKLMQEFYYPKLKKQMTLKAGKTLDFGLPKLLPTGCVVSDDTRYGCWIEGFEDEDNWMIDEDRAYGRHRILGAKAGVFMVHAWVNMFGDSIGYEITFELTVEPAKTPATSIGLNAEGTWENPYRLELGKKLKLKATVLPKNASKAVSWTSNWDGIAVSDKGVVQGVAIGATEIIATTTDGSNLQTMIVVDIVEPTATKLTMNKKKLSMKVGATAALSVKFKPASLSEERKRVVWFSDDTGVAEVDAESGLIIAKSKGTATIYAYGMNADGVIDSALHTKCKVTVK